MKRTTGAGNDLERASEIARKKWLPNGECQEKVVQQTNKKEGEAPWAKKCQQGAS